jgi:hypothetical protein
MIGYDSDKEDENYEESALVEFDESFDVGSKKYIDFVENALMYWTKNLTADRLDKILKHLRFLRMVAKTVNVSVDDGIKKITDIAGQINYSSPNLSSATKNYFSNDDMRNDFMSLYRGIKAVSILFTVRKNV